MKTYSFTHKGKQYSLSGLTLDVKDEVLDPIRATLLDRAQRMFDKKLITPAKFARAEALALGAGLNSPIVLDELSQQENLMRLISCLLPEDVATPEFVNELFSEQATHPNGSLSRAIKRVLADAYPQAASAILADIGEGEEGADSPKVVAPAA